MAKLHTTLSRGNLRYMDSMMSTRGNAVLVNMEKVKTRESSILLRQCLRALYIC
uniref:Uncharacterized protein n=1 Tax=Helianthus annuus TaxID=4232 RepID=A0A251V533_HELAN